METGVFEKKGGSKQFASLLPQSFHLVKRNIEVKLEWKCDRPIGLKSHFVPLKCRVQFYDTRTGYAENRCTGCISVLFTE